MVNRFAVKVELSAGEMAAVVRALEKVRLEEYAVCECSREWSNNLSADNSLRKAFASALSGYEESEGYSPERFARWSRYFDLVWSWARVGYNAAASMAAAASRKAA